MKDILRKQWGYEGYVTSDGGAIDFIYKFHHYTKTMVEAVAVAVINGTQVETPGVVFPQNLVLAVKQKLLTEDLMDVALYYLMVTRLKLGEFDLDTINPLKKIPYEEANSPKHRQLALELARKSIVLLKNDHDILPTTIPKTIGLIGPNCDSKDAIGGNYRPSTDVLYTALQALRNYTTSTVLYAAGCPSVKCNTTAKFDEAVDVVHRSDLIIMFMGIDQSIEGEMRDRLDITLPGYQENLIQRVVSAAEGQKPVVLVLLNGGAVTIMSETIASVSAIVEAFYPGNTI